MAAAPSRFRSVSEDDLDNLLAFFERLVDLY